MKKVKNRSLAALLLALALVLGLGVYVYRYLEEGARWAAFSANQSIYSDGLLMAGQITDRKGVLLARADETGRDYAQDPALRRSCLHALGDFEGRIPGALTLFRDRLAGFDLVNGLYNPRHRDNTLTLTLDSALCQTAGEALAGRPGAVALCDYSTGEILCMVSAPGFDPLDVPEPLPEGAYLNRVTGATYPPGSVFKLVTLAAALENIPDVERRSFFCDGGLDLEGHYVKCAGEHGSQTIEQAFANSCNCAFAQLSLELGGETLARYAEALGLTQALTLDGLTLRTGSFEAAPDGSPALAWSGIGQSTDLVSPYGMLRLVSAIANGGILREPSLLLGGSGKETALLGEKTARALGDCLHYNVVSGYGSERFPGLPLCAKSGTAELGNGRSHAWFVGFLRDEAHPYAFVVLIERGGSGLTAAGALANTLLQAAVSP